MSSEKKKKEVAEERRNEREELKETEDALLSDGQVMETPGPDDITESKENVSVVQNTPARQDSQDNAAAVDENKSESVAAESGEFKNENQADNAVCDQMCAVVP